MGFNHFPKITGNLLLLTYNSCLDCVVNTYVKFIYPESVRFVLWIVIAIAHSCTGCISPH